MVLHDFAIEQENTAPDTFEADNFFKVGKRIMKKEHRDRAMLEAQATADESLHTCAHDEDLAAGPALREYLKQALLLYYTMLFMIFVTLP